MTTTPARGPGPVCILAGGLATRLGDLGRRKPKALVEVAGKPFVFHQLDLLHEAGVRRVVLCVGWLGDQIEGVVGGRYEGIEIAYSSDGPSPCGTLGALRRAAPLLGERFLVLYGDSYLQVDFASFEMGWLRSGLPAGMTVLRNAGRFGPSNAAYRAGRVERYDKRQPDAAMEWIDYGLGALTAGVLGLVPEASDLAELYCSLASRGQVYGFAVRQRFYEIGTPEAVAETDRFLRRRIGGTGSPAT